MAKNKSLLKRFSILPKLFCVLVAFVIWLYVAAVENPDHEETIYQVPVNLVGVSSIESNYNLSVFSGYDTTVDLTVKGQLSTIKKYSVDDYNITADISHITDGGRHTVKLFFDMPTGVVLSSSSITSAELYIDERTTVTIDVYPRLKSITVPDNYELGELVSDTETVVVSGPKILVDDVSHAAVYLDAGRLESSISMVGKLSLVNKAGEDITNPFLKLSKNEVKVSIPLYEYKELTVVVPTKHGYFNDSNSKITISPATIAVKGDPVVLDRINEISTATIDETKMLGDSTLILGLIVPNNISIASGETSSVSVTVNHIGTSTRNIAVDDINVIGAKDIDYSLQTAVVNITLRGPSDVLELMDEKNIVATVDLTGYEDTEGVISVPLSVAIKDSEYGVYAVGEYSVQVKLG
ncbi:MAG: hypothetical protein IKL36_02790 [Clostridia bacterium]|nr:hypothetical protein [Clostridia bacterium]